MALTPNFSVSESLANPDELTFTDTSTGSDGTITNRTITILLANGNWLSEAGESTTEVSMNWSYSQSSITLDLLSNSTACDITVKWLAGSTVVYTKENTFCFNLYDYLFMLQLLQGNTSAPQQLQDTNYLSNSYAFIVNLFNEENAITYGGDIYSSQNAMNQNLNFITNEADYF